MKSTTYMPNRIRARILPKLGGVLIAVAVIGALVFVASALRDMLHSVHHRNFILTCADDRWRDDDIIRKCNIVWGEYQSLERRDWYPREPGQ